ncbi:MAG: copper chaperone PCu(A)C [Pseudomonadota bacterium]
MKRFFTLSAAAVMTAACSQAEPETQEVVVVEDAPVASETMEVAADVVEEGMPLDISEGYILAPLKGRDVTAGYFIIENNGADARMVSASSPIAAEVELHTHTMNDGVMQMREVEGIDLPTGEVVTFRPGGLHLMLFGFDRAEGQTETPVTLQFEDGEELTLTLPIRERE